MCADAQTPDDAEFGNRSSSEMPDLVGDLDNKTGTLLSGSGRPITADIRSLCMDAPIADDPDVRNRKPSAMPDFAGDLGEKTLGPWRGCICRLY